MMKRMLLQRLSTLSRTRLRVKTGLNGIHGYTLSSLIQNREEISKFREDLRLCGTEQDGVSLQLAADCESDSALCSLGTTTAVVTLNNPAARNALTGKMMAELADAVEELANNSAWQTSLSAVILRGSDNFFCAGADIRVAAEHLSTKEGGRAMSTLMIDTLTKFRHLPFITVASIRGGAVGGGAELATAADYRLMDDTGSLRFVHARMGVSPGWGGATRLVRLVGRPQALALLGTAKKYEAKQCLEIGLVDQLVSTKDDDMDIRLVKFLDEFVHADATVLHAAKRVVAGSEDAASFADAVTNEQNVFLEMWGGPANLAALSAAKKKK